MQTDRAYNELGRAQHFHLKRDGYIIGIEKREIEIGNNKFLSGLTSKNGYKKRFQLISKIDGETEEKKETRTVRNDEFLSVTEEQDKVMLVTQITKNFPNQEYIYNAYKDDLDGEYDYELSFSKINEIFKDLPGRLKKEDNTTIPYTHVLIMSMGWNNDQVESLWRYNKILENLAIAAKKQSEPFKPLVFAITWPSSWATISDSYLQKKISHLLSYGNKADDADEIGYTWLNWIMNHKIPEVITSAQLSMPPKTVVIGHSFGARLLSRALFSSSHIKPIYKSHNSVDLFLGLQGAFSANRFLPEGSCEGYPYSDFKELSTKIVLTTSTNDDANPIAYYLTRAGHVGGHRGLSIAEDKDNREVFDVKVWNQNSPQMDLPVEKVLLVNATSIVKEENGLSAHNDILDEEMGVLMWNFIRKIP
jgi:hypothetical protein